MTWKTSTEKLCPLVKEKCVEHRCVFWTHLAGTNPQTGAPVDEWDCAVAWLPFLLIENSKFTRECSGETNGLRQDIAAHSKANLMLQAAINAGALTNETERRNNVPALDGH
jgi:hypothetical protein